MKRFAPVLAVVTAGVLWGIISLFIRHLSAAGLDALQITWIRLAVAAPLFTLAVAALRREALRIRPRDLWMFVGTGIISIVLFNVCYFYTMVQAQASVAVVLLYTSPVFIMLLSAILFKERVTPVKIAALVLTVAGCACVAGLSGTSGLTPLTLLTGLASGFFYGLYTIFGRYALARYGSLTVTVYTFVLGFCGALPVCGAGEVVQTVAAAPGLLWWCLGIGVLCTVVPYFLYTWGLARLEPTRAAILVAVEPMVGAVLGLTLWHESRSPVKLVGIVLILAALILPGLPIGRQPAETQEDRA